MVHLPFFRDNTPLTIDCETTGLDYWNKDFQLIGFGLMADYIQPTFVDLRQQPRAIEWLKETTPRIKLINHHVKADVHFMMAAGVGLPASTYCTMNAEALLDEHWHEYGLDAVAYRRLGKNKIKLPGGPTNMAAVDPEILAAYGANDALLAWEIAQQQMPEIIDQELERVMALEMELLPVLAMMEHAGVKVDIEAAHKSIPVLTDKIDTLQWEINNDTGGVFNVNSTPQIRTLFKPEKINKWQYQLVDGTLCECTKTGGPSIDQHVLKEMQHPMAAKIRRLRKLLKTRDTFVMKHILGHADERGYVHTTFNQTKNDTGAGVGPGRLSSTDPALQQIPARDLDTAEVIRSMFLPDEGAEWLCMDHSQIDFRMCCHLIQDQRIYDMYAENPDMDFHQMVSDMTSIPRNAQYAGAPNCKTINLSMAFGAGPGKTAKNMGMPFTLREDASGERMWLEPGPEAEALFSQYHGRFPRIKKFSYEASSVAKARGFVKTFMGRRIRFPRGGYHKAAGLLYQSYAAEVQKCSIVRAAKLIAKEKLPVRLMLTVHDEMAASIFGRQSVQGLKHTYTDWQSDDSPYRLRVPVRCSTGVGKNWFEASKK